MYVPYSSLGGVLLPVPVNRVVTKEVPVEVEKVVTTEVENIIEVVRHVDREVSSSLNERFTPISFSHSGRKR